MSDSCLPEEGCADDYKPLLLQDLPTDVLLVIFHMCDVDSLLSLSQTCKRVNSIINEDCLWLERSRKVNVSNQVSNEIKNRSFSILSCKDRFRISQNWNSGWYQETVYFNNRTKFMPWLRMDSDIMWLSRGQQISAFKRRTNSLAPKPLLTFQAHREDVSRFVVKNGKIISGGSDGSLSTWDLRKKKIIFAERYAHNSDVTDVDFDGNELIVTASKDETIKVWNIRDNALKPKMTVTTEDRIWTVALKLGSSEMLCYGTAGLHQSKSPLVLYDIERCQMAALKNTTSRYGAGILHVLWEDPNTLLACGYDRVLRMWDIRTLACVQVWSDPFDVVLYSIASDHNHTLLCGTAQHARVQMWDKRHSRSLQMYFMNSDHSSPVYSLAFDPSQLFVALDQSLHMMDFSGFRNKTSHTARDFRAVQDYFMM